MAAFKVKFVATLKGKTILDGKTRQDLRENLSDLVSKIQEDINLVKSRYDIDCEFEDSSLLDVYEIKKQSHDDIEEVMSFLFELETDNHMFGTRPCPTCQQISKGLGRDYGCVKKARDRNGIKSEG